MSLFYFGEGALFRVETYISTFYDDLSPLNLALFKNRSHFGEKASGTSAVSAKHIYIGIKFYSQQDKH